MTLGLAFWILMLLWLVFGVAYWRGMTGTWGPWGGGLLIFLTIMLLGWQIFGPPLRG